MIMRIQNLEAGNYNDLVRHFLARLLREGTVDAVLVSKRYPKGRNAAPVLVHDPEKLDGCAPLAPVQLVNAAHALVELTRDQPDAPKGEPRRIAAVLRPCEVRAAVELIKLKQIQPENLFLIGFDCPGVFDLKTYREKSEGDAGALGLARASADGDPEDVREACRLCTHFTGESADLSLPWMGSDAVQSEDGAALVVEVHTERGTELLKNMDAQEMEPSA